MFWPGIVRRAPVRLGQVSQTGTRTCTMQLNTEEGGGNAPRVLFLRDVVASIALAGGTMTATMGCTVSPAMADRLAVSVQSHLTLRLREELMCGFVLPWAALARCIWDIYIGNACIARYNVQCK